MEQRTMWDESYEGMAEIFLHMAKRKEVKEMSKRKGGERVGR